jgi:hypothetical protein
MYFEISEKNDEYKSYKYVCDDKTISYKYLKPLFNLIQSKIPEYIHPNILTCSSLIVIIITYLLKNIIPGLITNLLFSFGMIIYLILDSVDGIHARNTKKTSIIGEYLDHVGDVIISGFIVDELLKNFINDYTIRNKLALMYSLYFSKVHYESIMKQKITFEITDDVILGLSFGSIANIFKFDLLKITSYIFSFVINNIKFLNKIVTPDSLNYIIFSIIPLYLYLNTIFDIVKTKINEDYFSLNKFDSMNSYIFTGYYFIKMLIIYFGNIDSILSISLIDSYIIFNLINSKIFKVPIDYKVLVLLLFYYINPFITSILISIYTYYLIYNISENCKFTLTN